MAAGPSPNLLSRVLHFSPRVLGRHRPCVRSKTINSRRVAGYEADAETQPEAKGQGSTGTQPRNCPSAMTRDSKFGALSIARTLATHTMSESVRTSTLRGEGAILHHSMWRSHPLRSHPP